MINTGLIRKYRVILNFTHITEGNKSNYFNNVRDIRVYSNRLHKL